MRRSILKYMLILCIFMMYLDSAAQTQKSEKDKAPASTRVQRKAAKHKWKESRKIEMETKKAVKDHHKRIQTKKTRKMMKKEKRKGDKMRANKREFFLIRWFKYK